jgi:dTDP-glucose 4,6-dehydratase
MPEDHLGIADPLNPGNAYCAAKRSSEHLCALYRQANGLETVIARCFAFVGQDLPLNVHFAIGNFIRDALQRHEVVVGGDGSPIRSYMDQRDLARWLLVLLEHGTAGEAFNVGSDEGLPLGAIAHRVRDLLAPKKEVKILGAQHNASFRSVYVPSIEKAKTVVGLRLEYTLDQAILETAKWVS